MRQGLERVVFVSIGSVLSVYTTCVHQLPEQLADLSMLTNIAVNQESMQLKALIIVRWIAGSCLLNMLLRSTLQWILLQEL